MAKNVKRKREILLILKQLEAEYKEAKNRSIAKFVIGGGFMRGSEAELIDVEFNKGKLIYAAFDIVILSGELLANRKRLYIDGYAESSKAVLGLDEEELGKYIFKLAIENKNNIDSKKEEMDELVVERAMYKKELEDLR